MVHWLEHLIPAVCGLAIAWRVGYAMAIDKNDDDYNRGWNEAARLFRRDE